MKAPERLETRRLVLRPYIDSDFEAFSLLLNDDSISKNHYLTENQQILKEEQSIFFSIINSYSSPQPILAWAICNKENEAFVGTCGLKPLKDMEAIECFYALLPTYRKNGYAIESMLKLLEFSFNDLKILKIVIFVHPNNTRIWKVAERIGMKYMGQLKHKSIVPKAMFFSIDNKEYKVQRFH
ncbi:MAG: GNAT family N-acetyltransferase [Candidatus Hodarchaeota archaeon]